MFLYYLDVVIFKCNLMKIRWRDTAVNSSYLIWRKYHCCYWFVALGIFKQEMLLEFCTGESGVNLDLCETCWIHLILIPAATNSPRLMLCSLCLLLSLIIQVTSPAKVNLGEQFPLQGWQKWHLRTRAFILDWGQHLCALLHTGQISHLLTLW